MKKSNFLIAACIVICSAMGFAQQPSPVKVSEGLVQGIFENGLTVYKGIPFAAPPVGELRWRAPQPPAKWEVICFSWERPRKARRDRSGPAPAPSAAGWC